MLAFPRLWDLYYWRERERRRESEDPDRERLCGLRKTLFSSGLKPCPHGLAFPEAMSKGSFRPIVQAWRSKACVPPQPPSLPLLPGAHWPYPKGRHPWQLDMGPGEVCIAKLTPIRSFLKKLSPQLPTMRTVLHLNLTLGLPFFLPQGEELKIPGASGQSGAQAVPMSQ